MKKGANLYQVNNGFVLLKRAKTPDEIERAVEGVKDLKVESVTGVIGVPGDKEDNLIIKSGACAAKVFDKIIIREDKNLRGREETAVPSILAKTVRAEAPNKYCQVIRNSATALASAIEQMKKNELVVYFYEDHNDSKNILNKFHARRV